MVQNARFFQKIKKQKSLSLILVQIRNFATFSSRPSVAEETLRGPNFGFYENPL